MDQLKPPPALQVLFEDEDLLALGKPAGLPTQATVDKGRANFYDLALGQFPFPLFLHHRLDKDTSGVMIFSKSRRMNPLLAALFQVHQIQKTYWALVNPKGQKMASQHRIENFLELQKKLKPQKMKSVLRGGQKAITEFTVITSQSSMAHLECRPLTGRTHQIRVHLSEWGFPILGDSLYGGKDSRVPRLMLHAHHLDFRHPLSGELVKISCPPPSDFKKIIEKLNSPSA